MASLATGLGLSEQDAALGILRVVNANMERAIRAISLERGYDRRSFTLVPFGGAGPVHGCELAQELGIPRVLIPARPGSPVGTRRRHSRRGEGLLADGDATPRSPSTGSG